MVSVCQNAEVGWLGGFGLGFLMKLWSDISGLQASQDMNLGWEIHFQDDLLTWTYLN